MIEVRCEVCGKHLGDVPDIEELRRRIYTHLHFCGPVQVQVEAERAVRRAADKPRRRRLFWVLMAMVSFIAISAWASAFLWMHVLSFGPGLAVSMLSMVPLWLIQFRINRRVINWSYSWKCAPGRATAEGSGDLT